MATHDLPMSASRPLASLARVLPRPQFSWRLPVGVLLAALVLLTVATGVHLQIPGPTGPYAVGREQHTWVDQARPETHTADPADRRTVAVQLWYPAVAGTGTPGPYVPELGSLADGLAAAGIGRVEQWGLQLVRHDSRDNADVAAAEAAFPVVLLEPGNETNVAFYATLAEELASHGYVVVGVDHPYQVAAVPLPGGAVATYDPAGDVMGAVTAKIDERVADLGFVLAQLEAEAATLVDGRLDLDQVAAVGHSNGGLAALELCRQRTAILACVNLDGQGAGGPFSTEAEGVAPDQPFLFLTKEVELHPEIHRRFEAAGAGAVRVVLPAAAHHHFTDGAMFHPTLDPTRRTADQVATTARSLVLAFLDRHVRGHTTTTFDGIGPTTDIYVNVYPLEGRPPIP